MLIPIRCYAVVAGTHAGDPLAGELLRTKDRAAAESIAAAIQAHARRGSVLGAAQYFVLEVDDDLELPVTSPAEAVAQGYTIRVAAGDSALVVSATGARSDRIAEEARAEEARQARAAEAVRETEAVPPVEERSAPAAGRVR